MIIIVPILPRSPAKEKQESAVVYSFYKKMCVHLAKMSVCMVA